MLPDSLSPEVRYLVYGLLLVHLLIFVSYLFMLRKSWQTTPQGQVQEEISKVMRKKRE